MSLKTDPLVAGYTCSLLETMNGSDSVVGVAIGNEQVSLMGNGVLSTLSECTCTSLLCFWQQFEHGGGSDSCEDKERQLFSMDNGYP